MTFQKTIEKSTYGLKVKNDGFEMRARIGYQLWPNTLIYGIVGITRIMALFKYNGPAGEILEMKAFDRKDDRQEITTFLPIVGMGIEHRIYKDWTINVEGTISIGKNLDVPTIKKYEIDNNKKPPELNKIYSATREHNLASNELRITLTRHF